MTNAILRILSGPRQGQNLTLAPTSQTIGRDAECQITLNDYDGVSRQHARLWQEKGEWIIEDLGSTNGVRVNGQTARRAVLKLPCRLQLGDFIAEIAASTPPASAPSRLANSRTIPSHTGWIVAGVLGMGIVFLGARAFTGETKNTTQKTSTVPAQVLEPSANRSAPTTADSGLPPASPQTFESQNGKLSTQALQSAKSATVMIVTRTNNGYGFGSGFLAGDAQHIVTNRHVVVSDEGAGQVQDCLIFFNSGTSRETKLEVRADQIVPAPTSGNGEDFTSDLAVIRLGQPVSASLAAPLAIGHSEDISETDTIHVFGFPLGAGTLTLNDQLPSVSVKAVGVERVQRRSQSTPGDEIVTVLQLGGTVTHGNSGGPVINSRGEVVGVISRGEEGTGMVYAIPTVFVRALLP